MDFAADHEIEHLRRSLAMLPAGADALKREEAMALLRGLRGLELIGGDVVEVAPPFDPSGNTALVGATLMYEILCLLAEVRGG